MKKQLIIIFISFISYSSYSQDTINKIIDEIHITLNNPSMNYDFIEGKTGFGFGFTKIFLKERKLSVTSGVNVNWTTYIQTYNSSNPSFYYKDVEFKNSFLSIPLAGRINFGDVIKFYFETGVYYDFGLASKKAGDYYSLVDPENHIYQKTKSFDEPVDSYNYFGYSVAFGMIYKIGDIAITVKPEINIGENKSADRNYFGHHKLSLGVQF
jgi:hypothetical protein